MNPSDNSPGGSPSRGQTPRNPQPRPPVPAAPAPGASPGPARGTPQGPAPVALPGLAQSRAVQLTVPLSPTAFRVTILAIPCLLLLIVILLVLLLSDKPATAVSGKVDGQAGNTFEAISQTTQAVKSLESSLGINIDKIDTKLSVLRQDNSSQNNSTKDKIEDVRLAIAALEGKIRDLIAVVPKSSGQSNGKPSPEYNTAVSQINMELTKLTTTLNGINTTLGEIKTNSSKLNGIDPKHLQALPELVKRLETIQPAANDDTKKAIRDLAEEIAKLTQNINQYSRTVSAATVQSLTLMQTIRAESTRYEVLVVLSHGKECDARVAAVIGDKALAGAPSGAGYKNYRLGVVAESQGVVRPEWLLEWPSADLKPPKDSKEAKEVKVPSYQRKTLPDPKNEDSAPDKLTPAKLSFPPADGSKTVQRVVFVTSSAYAPPVTPAAPAADPWNKLTVDAILLARKVEGPESLKRINAWAEFCRGHMGASLVIIVPEDFAKLVDEPDKLRDDPAGKLLNLYLRRLTQPDPTP